MGQHDCPLTVFDLVDNHPPGNRAMNCGDHLITYGQLAEASRRAATGLEALGVGAVDRVALWLPNVPAWLALYLACTRLGAIAVAVNTRFRSAEVCDIVGRAECKLLVLWPGFKRIEFMGILRDVDPGALELLRSVVVYHEHTEFNPAPALAGRHQVSMSKLLEAGPLALGRGTANSPCNILTTSGATSKPKFVLHDQAEIARHARCGGTPHGADATLRCR